MILWGASPDELYACTLFQKLLGQSSEGAYTARMSMDVRSGSVRVNFSVSVLPLSVRLEMVQPLLFLRSTSMPLLSLGKPKTWN